MSPAKTGDTVKIHYIGKLEDQSVFDSSAERDPLEFKIGESEVIRGLQEGVVGMASGQKKSLVLPPDEAFGQIHAELIVDVEMNQFPQNITPTIGEQLQLKRQDGSSINVTITNTTKESVTLDANHPLAGLTLFFDIELVEIS